MIYESVNYERLHSNFSFAAGSAYDLPKYYQFKNNLTNPDYYKAVFTECALAAAPVLGVSSAISRPPAPIFVSLPSLQSTWESLQVIIPTTLTYGIVGYPFLMPGPVGGDYVSENLFRKFGTPPCSHNYI